MSVLYVEVCEDILYVMLNILLAVSIAENIKINNYIGKDEEFNRKLKSIIQTHNDEYKIYYQCLDELRMHKIINCTSEHTLKHFSKRIAAGI